MTISFQEPRPQRPCDLLVHPNGVEAPALTPDYQLRSSAMKKARVIITFDCRRGCPYCCNNSPSMQALMQPIDSIGALLPYDMVMLTGGEPMLDPGRTLSIAQEVRDQKPQRPLYLYTARWSARLSDALDLFDGVHYTLHASATREDIRGFLCFQDMIMNARDPGSCRLYINPCVTHDVTVRPSLWTRIESKPWVLEKDLTLPEGEDLLVLT